MKPTVEQVAAALRYDPDTGFITWIQNRKNGPDRTGREAGSKKCRRGRPDCIVIKWGNTALKAHHVAWVIMTGNWPTSMIDHRNGDPFDNRWSNMRIADEVTHWKELPPPPSTLTTNSNG